MTQWQREWCSLWSRKAIKYTVTCGQSYWFVHFIYFVFRPEHTLLSLTWNIVALPTNIFQWRCFNIEDKWTLKITGCVYEMLPVHHHYGRNVFAFVYSKINWMYYMHFTHFSLRLAILKEMISPSMWVSTSIAQEYIWSIFPFSKEEITSVALVSCSALSTCKEHYPQENPSNLKSLCKLNLSQTSGPEICCSAEWLKDSAGGWESDVAWETGITNSKNDTNCFSS